MHTLVDLPTINMPKELPISFRNGNCSKDHTEELFLKQLAQKIQATVDSTSAVIKQSENLQILDTEAIIDKTSVIIEHSENVNYTIYDTFLKIFTETLDINSFLFKTFTYNNYSTLFFEGYLILSILFLIIFIVIIDYILNYKIILINLISRLYIFILLMSLLLLNNINFNSYIFDYLIIHDATGVFIKNVLFISLICCILISSTYIKLEKIINYEYFLLIGLSIIGLCTMICANDLTTLYLGIELQSLAFYLLAAFKIYSNFSTEAGLKYFILGAFSSGLLLFGCSLIYGFTGTTNFSELNLLFLDNDIPVNIYNGILLGNIFITIGILFKLGTAPFHM